MHGIETESLPVKQPVWKRFLGASKVLLARHLKKHFIYTGLNEVKKNASMFGLKKVKVIKCIFPNNLPRSLKNKKIKLCHIDVNTYKSTKKAFYFVDKRMEKNGIIIFDDYGRMHLEKEVIDNFLNNKKGKFIPLPTGQALFIKL